MKVRPISSPFTGFVAIFADGTAGIFSLPSASPRAESDRIGRCVLNVPGDIPDLHLQTRSPFVEVEKTASSTFFFLRRDGYLLKFSLGMDKEFCITFCLGKPCVALKNVTHIGTGRIDGSRVVTALANGKLFHTFAGYDTRRGLHFADIEHVPLPNGERISGLLPDAITTLPLRKRQRWTCLEDLPEDVREDILSHCALAEHRAFSLCTGHFSAVAKSEQVARRWVLRQKERHDEDILNGIPFRGRYR